MVERIITQSSCYIDLSIVAFYSYLCFCKNIIYLKVFVESGRETGRWVRLGDWGACRAHKA